MNMTSKMKMSFIWKDYFAIFSSNRCDWHSDLWRVEVLEFSRALWTILSTVRISRARQFLLFNHKHASFMTLLYELSYTRHWRGLHLTKNGPQLSHSFCNTALTLETILQYFPTVFKHKAGHFLQRRIHTTHMSKDQMRQWFNLEKHSVQKKPELKSFGGTWRFFQ